MSAVGYSHSFLRGLSDFWTRFFADANQLDALYQGSAVLIGQAYLDLMSATLGVSLRDAIALDREYYRVLPMREDELRFVKGVTTSGDRWAFTLPDPVVGFASLDNRVFEPTASLEPQRDYDVIDRVAYFKADPTDPFGTGIPLAGYARRTVDISVGGRFSDPNIPNWVSTTVRKGDVLRVLDVSPAGTQRKRADYTIVLSRVIGLYVSIDKALPASATGLSYVILRTPAVPEMNEPIVFTAGVATFTQPRVDEGSVRLFARTASGADVREGVDYVVNYESGTVTQIGGTPWQGGTGPFGVKYTRRTALFAGTTGVVAVAGGTARVLQMAAWAPDALVDRRTLANNFGALIGREADSSEAYRSFLQGIFQLYVLGPVFERVESALNVVLNLPVVRDDGEVVQGVDTSDLLVDRVRTTRPETGLTAVYEFPKGTPIRADLVAGRELLSFEPLTDVVTVTDYVQTPNWWHGSVIPLDLFSKVEDALPPVARRTASATFVNHVVGASDLPEAGDPGLYVGGDETGFVPSAHGAPGGHAVFRRRMAFVLMDRYLKHHVFSVTFDATAVSRGAGAGFGQSIFDLNNLVLSARPSHTYALTRPVTSFRDVVSTTEGVLKVGWVVGSRSYGPDSVVFADRAPLVGGNWLSGAYFTYGQFTESVAFPTVGVAVTLGNVPTAPRVGRLVRVYVNAVIGGTRVIENVDYTVNYSARTVTRLTAWTSTTANTTYTQANIGNIINVAGTAGDMPVLVGGVDPALVTAEFNPAAAQWDGTITPQTAPRDIGMVERALIVRAH